MNIYIFRHGLAENKDESPDRTDEGRRLTKEGEEQVRWACERAKELGLVPTVILTSPLVRARQSAEVAQRRLHAATGVREDPCLRPDAKVEEVYASLSKLKAKDSVVLVTHLPLLGHLFESLLDWNVWDQLDFDNGAIARIDSKIRPKARSGTLVWLMPMQGKGQ